mgnify:CR=1 FL=1
MAGKVYLVGAGPGDYRLISVKGCDCLKQADVVVYDRLADERILSYAPGDAEFVYVGKASSNHTMKQEEISRLLVERAKQGKCVVRLKGGDPFVFGRGGEEALLLEQNGLPFEIVPGITSAISVPAYAGIPVTHRGVAASFAVVTGHEDPAKGASGSLLYMFWTVTTGSGSTTESYHIPALWKVQYSTDGVNFTTLPKEYIVHPRIWSTVTTPSFGVTAFSQFVTALPASLLGQSNVYIRIRATEKTAVTDDLSSETGGQVKGAGSAQQNLAFGQIGFRYR